MAQPEYLNFLGTWLSCHELIIIWEGGECRRISEGGMVRRGPLMQIFRAEREREREREREEDREDREIEKIQEGGTLNVHPFYLLLLSQHFVNCIIQNTVRCGGIILVHG